MNIFFTKKEHLAVAVIVLGVMLKEPLTTHQK